MTSDDWARRMSSKNGKMDAVLHKKEGGKISGETVWEDAGIERNKQQSMVGAKKSKAGEKGTAAGRRK